MTRPVLWALCLMPLLLPALHPQEGAGEEGLEEGGYSEEDGGDGGDGFEGYLEFGQDTGLTVSATPETTQQIKAVEKGDIERAHAPDLAALLEEALDIGITRYGAYGNQTEINIRGFDTERIAVLIDGVPANSARSGEFDVSQIGLAGVERVEVIYGGSDTKYNVSGALGGVINIITLKKQQKGLALGGSFTNTGYGTGSYNRNGAVEGAHYEDLADTQRLDLSAGLGMERLSLRVNWFGTRAANHYLYKDYYGFTRRKQSNQVWDTGLGGTVIFSLPNEARLSSAAQLYAASKQYPVTGVSEGYGLERDFSLKESLSFHAPVIFRDDLETEASLSYALNTMRYGEISEGQDHGITFINRWHWYPSQRITLRGGVDWRFIAVDSSETTGTAGNLGGLYVTAEYAPAPPFLIIASLKGATDAKQGVLIPKLGVRWQIFEGLALKNNYFRSFKFPDFDDLFYRSADGFYIGNPGLKPEDGWGADVIAEFTLNDMFGASAASYVQWTEQSIHWVKHGRYWTPENVGTGFFVGFDLRPALTLPIRAGPFQKVVFSWTWQLQISWFLTDSLTFADSLRIPYMPAHILGGSVDIQWGSGSLRISAHYESLRYADTGNHMALDPYCLLNITVNQNIGKHLTFFAVVRNGFNQLYTSFAEYPMPGISCALGVRFQFPLTSAP
ncbi:MAG: TonB-dependent receptor [Spirochaetaceae bacterium]|jgi:vitamin B12 transporter|nr:TonB-dependent receptor [Spirochaetaceae bacterium]